jgi:hypothetical protein
MKHFQLLTHNISLLKKNSKDAVHAKISVCPLLHPELKSQLFKTQTLLKLTYYDCIIFDCCGEQGDQHEMVLWQYFEKFTFCISSRLTRFAFKQ